MPRYRAPILMATQHPDSTRMITASQEVEEAIEAINVFRCDEIMVDYEGKLTPYHQPEWIVEKAHEKGLMAGINFLISLRIPNDLLEGVSRHVHSIVTAIITNWKAKRMGLEQPVRYLIIPMVESTNHFQAVVRRVSRL